MLVSTKMLTGFNTDVPHEGHIYHVQTEDRGRDNPFFESLIYIGGTIVATKLTPYTEQLDGGADEDAIASLLKRQHQVIIAAIRAGRIDDLIKHTRKQQADDNAQDKPSGSKSMHAEPVNVPGPPKRVSVTVEPVSPAVIPSSALEPPKRVSTTVEPVSPAVIPPSALDPPAPRVSGVLKVNVVPIARKDSGGLNFDQLIDDYVQRGPGQARLNVTVLTPKVFTAGRNIGLRVQVMHGTKPIFDATVTVKIIGTAFKPQVFIARAGGDGIASFSLALPAFTSGTAAIVIEAQSEAGRGELKNLIRRV